MDIGMKLYCVFPAFFGSNEFYCVAKSKREAKEKYYKQKEQRNKWVDFVRAIEIEIPGYKIVEDNDV